MNSSAFAYGSRSTIEELLRKWGATEIGLDAFLDMAENKSENQAGPGTFLLVGFEHHGLKGNYLVFRSE